jgi:hypothetical protein
MNQVILKRTLLLFIYCGSSVWTQGLTLARQALYHLSHSTSPVFGYYFHFFLSVVSLSLFLSISLPFQSNLNDKMSKF